MMKLGSTVSVFLAVVASEAKQSSFPSAAAKLDCFVAALLAMTEKEIENGF
jgi:hypothetical protein